MKAALDGSGEAKIVDALVSGNGRNFDLGNSGIYYRAGDPNSVWFLSFATGKSRAVVKSDRRLVGGFSVSPDGQWLVYAQADQQPGSDLMPVENFH
jgi:tricorn protease-like protein